MFLESPSNPLAKMEVDQSHQAGRVSLRSLDWKGPSNAHIGGHFGFVASTGLTTGIAANGALFSARWTNADRALVLQAIRAWATIATAFTTAQQIAIDLIRVNAFTAGDTGQTALDIGDAGRRSRLNMKNSLVTNLRISNTGALTPGTGTEEAFACGMLSFSGLLNVVGSMAGGDLYKLIPGHEAPFVLSSNEGFRIRNRVAQGAVGVVTFDFELIFAEVPTSMVGA